MCKVQLNQRDNHTGHLKQVTLLVSQWSGKPVQQQARPEHAAELSNPRTQPMLSFAFSEDKLVFNVSLFHFAVH